MEFEYVRGRICKYSGYCTCTSNQSLHFTAETQAECAAAPVPGNSAGANADLAYGMVGPFVNMTLKG